MQGRILPGYQDEITNVNASRPMPWIGIYIATASLVCSIAMAADAFLSFRHRKFWFPCRLFSLNATSLTLIAIAMKLSVDLTTVMGGPIDQLAKLGGNVVLCIMMGNFMPSIGTMETREIFLSIMALGILVITLVVNICIQLKTGVIFYFQEEHDLVMFIMLVLLLILSFSSLTVPTTKQQLQLQYSKRCKFALRESSCETSRSDVAEKLKDDLAKYWLMAHTSCPQYVVARSVTCIASGLICLLAVAALGEACLRTLSMTWTTYPYELPPSDYGMTTTVVLAVHGFGIVAGVVAPAGRLFLALSLISSPRKRKKYCCKGEFKVERYWIQRLVEMKESPIALQIRNQHLKKLANDTKDVILGFCIRMQTVIVLASKCIFLISNLLASPLLKCCNYCKKWTRKLKNSNNNSRNDSGSEPSPEPDLRPFVLHLQGEEERVEQMARSNCRHVDHWLQTGKKREPRYLMQLLKKSTSSQGFEGVGQFDSDKVPSLDSEEPPNCWALVLVTLTSIAVALPNIKHHSIVWLKRSLNEGLVYVRLIEKNLDAEGDLINIRKAADCVWLGINLYRRWLDVDLRQMALPGKVPKEILEELSKIAKNEFMELKKRYETEYLEESPHQWPTKVLAANSMYRVCQTLLLDFESRDCQTFESLFEEITVMICDILGACLTNFSRAIRMECIHSTIERREETAEQALVHLGELENILNILAQKSLPSLDPDQMASIYEWHIFEKQQLSTSISSSSDARPGPSSSSDVRVTIE